MKRPAVSAKKIPLAKCTEARDFLSHDTDNPSSGVGEAGRRERAPSGSFLERKFLAGTAVKRLVLIAGELSGDLHGGHLMEALQGRVQIGGVGGPLMRAQGLDEWLGMETLSVMGFTDVLLALPRLIRAFHTLRNRILKERPDAVVFIDYPGFNLRMAKALRKRGYKGKLIHYICPTVWAWGKGRIEKMAQTLDLLLTILPFEPSCFAHTELPAHYVGHPLMQGIMPPGDGQGKGIALFPGSRHGEVERNFPSQLAALAQLRARYPDAEATVSVAIPSLAPLLRSHIEASGQPVHLAPRAESYNLMRSCRAALATSGTVTLELALHHAPTVVTYRLSRLNYLLARYLFRIRLPHYALPNILAKQELFPEVVGKQLPTDRIAEHLCALYEAGSARDACLTGCKNLRTLLGEGDASQEAARALLEVISHTGNESATSHG